MWQFFCASFEKNLTAIFGISEADARSTMAKAKGKYKQIIGNLPEFEKGDHFQMNIIGCAMLSAVVLSMSERPNVERLTVYYRSAMMIAPMKWFCRMSRKTKFTPQDIDGMKKTAAFRAADRNPYSWNMDYVPYDDGSD